MQFARVVDSTNIKYLNRDLKDGWKVTQIKPSHAGRGYSCWLVILEKDNDK